MVSGSSSYCSVSSCKNTGRLKKQGRPDLMFHRFPKNPTLRKEWVRLCGRRDDFNLDTAMICSDHFKPEDYQRNLRAELLGEGDKRKFLHPGIVPSRNIPTEVKRPKNSYVVNRDIAISKEEELAKRKALVQDALRWAESLGSTSSVESPQFDAKKTDKDPFVIKSEEKTLIDLKSEQSLIEFVNVRVPLESDADEFCLVETNTSDSNCSADGITEFVPLSLSSHSNIKNINFGSSTSASELPDSMQKDIDYKQRFQELQVKYHRCYNTLCCFKKAYTKLRSQNGTAKNKIIELRQKCKSLQTEVKEYQRKEKEKLKLSKRRTVQTQTNGENHDNLSWW